MLRCVLGYSSHISKVLSVLKRSRIQNQTSQMTQMFKSVDSRPSAVQITVCLVKYVVIVFLPVQIFFYRAFLLNFHGLFLLVLD